MRILYDHQAFSLQDHGGITRVFGEVVRFMNTQPTVSTDVLLGTSGTRMDFAPIVSPTGRLIHAPGAFFRPGLINYAINDAFSALVGPLLGNYDIYHSTYYRFLPTIRSKRRVATHHDCVPERFPNLFPDAGRIYKMRMKLFREADLILCVSAASQSDLLRFYDVSESKTVVVHNGVSQMKRTPQGAAELKAVLQEEYLLYVGSRHAYKNFEGLLTVYSRSDTQRSHRLLVLGGGPPSDEHSRLIAKLGLSGRVVFVPYASPALLAEAYACAVLLIYPSLYEGFGMPPLEAASLGCVSLVASNPASREIYQDAAFFFDPKMEGHFAQMLERALSDNEGRARLSAKARQLAGDFSWAECGRNTLAAYRSLI